MDHAPRTFGLVSGLGMSAGIFYYRALVDAHLERGLSPRLLMVHADVRRTMALAAAREVEELATYLGGLLRQLADGGAEIASIPAVSPQICAAELAARTPIPLINLLDVIAAEVERRKMQRVAVFGARVTMETNLFGRLRNCDVVPPRAEEIQLVSDMYTRIVHEGQGTPGDVETLRALAHALIERERLDGIVLAGTDFSFVLHPGNTDFAHVDGARVHIDAIMRELVR
jgi:aspartate racemase